MNLFEVSLTNYCNFSCEYCISNENRGKDKFSKPVLVDENGNLKVHPEGMLHEDYIANKDSAHDSGDWLNLHSLLTFIREKLSSEWVISLTGGEPLLYPKIDEFILELTKTHRVILSTNLSLIDKHPTLFTVPSDRLFFRIGFHPDSRTLQSFDSKIDLLISNNFKYIINYVLYPKWIADESFKTHITYFESKSLNYEVTPFEGTYLGVRYPRPEFCRTSFEEYIFSQHILKRLTSSPIGYKYIMAEPNGNIYECHAKKKCLGNIYSNNLKLEKFIKAECFYKFGCSMVKSANYYFNQFFEEKLSD